MKLHDRNPSFNWKHPLPLSLIRRYGYEIGIEQIIELEAATLIHKLEKDHHCSFQEGSAIPVEAIATALNIRATTRTCSASFAASIRQSRNGYEVSHGRNQHYYRRRFSLAHEIGHVVLSRLAGPFSNTDLRNTQGRRHEEEIVCDLFASALLIPKAGFAQPLTPKEDLTTRDINLLAKRFKVSKGAILRRIALLEGNILILWDYMPNPLKRQSRIEERISQVYPFVSQLSKHFIPLYCTLNSSRFSPNIVLESFLTGRALSGHVRVDDLGTIAGDEYFVRNIPFQKWNENTLEPNIVNKPKHFFNMATFIRP